eukprot:TRINITY_DN6780_c0_g1_i1.p1 TRINITY_DN6780_c0_g1~~TRINITY_DN6780_c0_g1_i1.p1  ORF type:complete len:317 (+),score=49.98 TRINITY_DN6780_c0_g1_i1:172-1122(+)
MARSLALLFLCLVGAQAFSFGDFDSYFDHKAATSSSSSTATAGAPDSARSEARAPLFPIYQGTNQQAANQLAGSDHAADMVHQKLKSAGLACTLPPEVLFNSGTYEGLIFSAQILKAAAEGSHLWHTGLGVRNFAHGMTRLVQLNLQAPCNKDRDSSFTPPCDPSVGGCDSTLGATAQLVQNVIDSQYRASKFKVVSAPLGSLTLPNLDASNYQSHDSPVFLNFQGSEIASGGLTHRNPTPFAQDSGHFDAVATIFSDLLSSSDAAPLGDIDSTDFYSGYYSTLVGIRNWFGCFASNQEQFGGCFSKGGQGVFTAN